MIQFDATLGKEELDTLCHLSLSQTQVRKQQRPLRILSAIFCGVTLLIAILYLTHNTVGAGVIMLGVAAVFGFLALGGLMLIQRSTLKRKLKQHIPVMNHPVCHYTIDQRGVSLRTQAGSRKIRWTDCTCWGTFRHYIYLQQRDHGILLLDRNCLTQAQADELYELLSSLPPKNA